MNQQYVVPVMHHFFLAIHVIHTRARSLLYIKIYRLYMLNGWKDFTVSYPSQKESVNKPTNKIPFWKTVLQVILVITITFCQLLQPQQLQLLPPKKNKKNGYYYAELVWLLGIPMVMHIDVLQDYGWKKYTSLSGT